MTSNSRMIRILIACVAIVALASALLAVDARLPLAEVVARALAKNPDLAADAPARKAAGLGLAVARAGYLPRVDFEQGYAAGNNPVYVFGTLLTQRRFTQDNFDLHSLNEPDAVHNLQTRILAQQNLWDGGRTQRQKEAAKLEIEASDRTHEEHLRQLLLTVLDGYYSVSLTRQSWDSAHIAMQSAESIVNQAQARVDSGLAVEADLLRSKVYLASARQQEIQAAGLREIAAAQLNRIMGEPLTAPLGETASLVPVKLPLPSEETLLVEQQRNRPDYQQLLVAVRQAELEVRNRKASYYPTLGAFGAWEMDNPSFSTYGGNNWAAGLNLRWNIFAGGGDSAQIQAAHHRLEQKQMELAAMESAMALEMHRALVHCRSAEQQVEASRAAEAQSQESLRILRNRYDAELATMTDLLSAETARSEARTRLAEAIYRYRISFGQVEFTAGTLGPTSAAMTVQ